MESKKQMKKTDRKWLDDIRVLWIEKHWRYCLQSNWHTFVWGIHWRPRGKHLQTMSPWKMKQ